MPPSQFINPLPMVSQFLPAPVDNSATEKLQIGAALQQLKNSGALSTTQAQGLNQQTLEGLRQGIMLGSPGAADRFEENRATRNFGTTATGAAAAQRGGLRFQLPPTGAKIGDLPGINVKRGVFPGVAAEKAKGEVLAEQQRSRKITGPRSVGPGGKIGGRVGTVVGTEDIDKQRRQGKVKSVDPEKAQAIINEIKQQFPGQAITNFRTESDKGVLWYKFEVNGVNKKVKVGT